MFKVGQKVVCIDTNWCDHDDEIFPILGHTYTVREIGIAGGIMLKEIVNRPRRYTEGFGEVEFMFHHFSPIEEKSQTMIEDVLAFVELANAN